MVQEQDKGVQDLLPEYLTLLFLGLIRLWDVPRTQQIEDLSCRLKWNERGGNTLLFVCLFFFAVSLNSENRVLCDQMFATVVVSSMQMCKIRSRIPLVSAKGKIQAHSVFLLFIIFFKCVSSCGPETVWRESVQMETCSRQQEEAVWGKAFAVVVCGWRRPTSRLLNLHSSNLKRNKEIVLNSLCVFWNRCLTWLCFFDRLYSW